MSKLYRNITKLSQTSKKNSDMKELEYIGYKNKMVSTQEDTEYDIRKICTDVNL